MTYTVDIALGLGDAATGLTLAAQLVDTTGVDTGESILTGFAEIGGGHYLWHYTAMPTDHRGGVRFFGAHDEVEATLFFVAINGQTAVTAEAIADAVWDEDVTDHATADSTGEALANADPSAVTVILAVSEAEAAAAAAGAWPIRTHHTAQTEITSTSTEDLNNLAALYFGLKKRRDDDDTEAVALIEATGGLTVLAEVAYTTTTDGGITVSGSSGDWKITPLLKPAATGALTAYQSLLAELKGIKSDGNTVTLWTGSAPVSLGVVQAVA